MFDGPVDIVGDVHGELGALTNLMAHLGYDADGGHRNRRHLIFVGDLCDRGPDSPGVAALVSQLVTAGRAQCVMGNHEFNVLRKSKKPGNGWWFAIDHDQAKGRHLDSRRAGDGERLAIYDFLSTLPLALERKDLRVIHAAWDDERLAQVERDLQHVGILELFNRYEAQVVRELVADGVLERAEQEDAQLERLLAAGRKPDQIFPALAEKEARKQMDNPIGVLTSGVETVGTAPFFSGGKWRMVDRVRWWDSYDGITPVVVGHYWRSAFPDDRCKLEGGDPDLFEGIDTNHWHGRRRNVFCVDYSAGRRYVERERGHPPGSASKLAALRWPERELVFDDGQRAATKDFGR